MSNETAHSLNMDTETLLNALQNQAAAGHVQLEMIVQLRQALNEAERQRGELAKREQEARAEAEAARAEAAATRAEANRALKALAESEQRYRIMGETIPFGVWWCNPKGEAEYVSPSFLELLDMTLEEQNKFGWTQRLVPEDVEPMMQHWMHCTSTGEFWEHEHRIIDRHGKINTVLSVGRPVLDEQGKIIAWVGVNLDHTERKRIEVELKQAKEALEEAMRAKDQFLANISHELRTPLTLILGPVRKLLSAENLTEEQRHGLGVVDRNARTLLKNVNDLLDLSKLDAGRMRVEYAETDLAWLARYVASHFESIADERGIGLVVETPSTLPGQADPEKLQRVLFNLLSNAFKFTPAQGSVRFQLQAANERALFTVEDTGPGIPKEMRQAIFERFRQADSSSTRRYGGTGLGLAIVSEFVHLHHGSVSVTDATGGGARFTVEIPLVAPAGATVKANTPVADQETARGAVAELTAHAGVPPCPRSAVSTGPLVLVVEDNPEMNEFVANALGDRCRVATAMDGQEGLEKAVSLCPDLIVSDIMMPRMSGEELVREVRRHRELDSTPILLLTAKADENLRVRLLSTGVQDCLVKPFVTEELVARAGSLIARKKQAEAAIRERTILLRAISDSTPDVIFVKDRDGRMRFTNPATLALIGKPLDEVRGKTDAEFLDDKDAARQVMENDRRVMQSGVAIDLEEEVPLPDGTRRVWLSRKMPYRDEDGQVVGLLGISRDITDRKRAEEALKQLTEELELRVRRRTAELATANRDLEAFAYTVSHDLRAPLRHVTAFVELLDQHSRPVLDEQGRHYLRTISSSAERMENLMDDLLRLSRLGRAALTETDVSLRQLVDEALEELAPQKEGRRIDWQINVLPQVRGDYTLLRSAVVNLLSNAVKYTRQRDPAKIEVGCQDRDNEVVFFVRDNGAGFDMQFADKLFGVFQRLHPAQKFEGTGVGLASVRRIIERHGGRTWAEGAVDRGATFFFSLPTKR